MLQRCIGVSSVLFSIIMRAHTNSRTHTITPSSTGRFIIKRVRCVCVRVCIDWVRQNSLCMKTVTRTHTPVTQCARVLIFPREAPPAV